MLMFKNSEEFKQYDFVVVDINVTITNFQLEIADDEKQVKSVLSIPLDKIQAKDDEQGERELIGSKVQSFTSQSTTSVYGNNYIQADMIHLKDKKDNDIILLRGGK